MHNKWLSDTSCQFHPYHPEFHGYLEFMKQLRAESTNRNEYSTHIAFPFDVETHIYDKINLAWRDIAVKMIFIRFNYYTVTENDVFDVLSSIPFTF